MSFTVLVVARLLAAGQRDRGGSCGVSLGFDGLVHGHALVAREDVAETVDRRVLTGDGHLQVVLLKDSDHRAGEEVVRHEDAVHLAASAREHLLEDRARALGVGNALLPDEGPVTRLELGLDDRVVALREERRVEVGRRTVEHGDGRCFAPVASTQSTKP